MRASRRHMPMGGCVGAGIKRNAEGIALGRNLQLSLSYELFDAQTAREFTRFTANPHCGPVIAPACCSTEAAARHLGPSAMNHQDGPDVFGARELTPVEEQLWSLKVVMAKTGLSRSTLYAYIAVGAFPTQRRLGRRRVAWFASDVRDWIASRPAGGIGRF